MNKNRLRITGRRLILGAVAAIFLIWCLEPTAWLFDELYHLTGVGPVYYGYSVFRAAGYFFGEWPYHVPASVLAGLLVALPWWQALKSIFRRAE